MIFVYDAYQPNPVSLFVRYAIEHWLVTITEPGQIIWIPHHLQGQVIKVARLNDFSMITFDTILGRYLISHLAHAHD